MGKPATRKPKSTKQFQDIVSSEVTKKDQQLSELQERLTSEQDARKEDRFVFIVLIVMLLDVVFFTIMPTFGGPIALLILQLLVLIPLANRMGMQEISQLLSRVLDRMVSKSSGD